MFIRSRHINFYIFLTNQEYYKLPKQTIKTNGKVHQNLYQDKTSMDMTLNEFKFLTSTCWNEKNQRLTIDMAKDNYIGTY